MSKRERLRPDFFDPIRIQPVSSLTELRQMVLQRSKDRMPKWKFRIAEDLVIQMQPKWEVKGRPAVLFECLMIMGDSARPGAVNGEVFKNPRGSLRFRIGLSFDTSGTYWELKPTRSPISGALTLRERAIKAFQDGAFDRLEPGMLLEPRCLSCNKRLTDPASMARMIGPECAGGSNSLTVPWFALGQDERHICRTKWKESLKVGAKVNYNGRPGRLISVGSDLDALGRVEVIISTKETSS